MNPILFFGICQKVYFSLEKKNDNFDLHVLRDIGIVQDEFVLKLSRRIFEFQNLKQE